MKIINTKVAFLNESIVASGLPFTTGIPEYRLPNEKDIKRAYRLAKQGGGHNNFLKGIRVGFYLKYSHYTTPQLQRYNFFDIVSSQSKMVKLAKLGTIKDNVNKYVFNSTIKTVDTLINIYNVWDFETGLAYFKEKEIKTKQEAFMYLISNVPLGFELWEYINTNYLQLRTMYHQRNKHKLEDWHYFREWCRTLPYSEFITE